ncbi:MAG: hypothetical protein IJ156_09605 [Bacteroidales bacterium]|nr:hypothetical protein [Bacteroidales bacterium]
MKRFAFLLFLCLAVSAQAQTAFNPNFAWNTVRAEWGMQTMMDSDHAGSAGEWNVLTLSYTRRIGTRWGVRGGVQYAPEHCGIQDFAGLPLAAVWRSRTYGFDETLPNMAVRSMEDIVRDGATGQADRIGGDLLLNALLTVFRRAEGFVGITPGYLFGDGHTGRLTSSDRYGDDGIRLNRRFYATADAGFTISIPVWRLSLDVTPAFHYLITGNVSDYFQAIDPLTDRPVGAPVTKTPHWLFSLNLGASILF